MNTSGDAAEQVVRMSLEAGEVALKISGKGAERLAALLYAALKDQKKTKGRIRLETLVRSGKPLTVFSVKESDLKKFVRESKRYGILYSAIRDPRGSSDGMVDIMVKQEDAPRLNRIVERFRLSNAPEAAEIKTEIERSRTGKESPFAPQEENPSLSGPTSGKKEGKGRSGFSIAQTKKPSVRRELGRIQERRKQEGLKAGQGRSTTSRKIRQRTGNLGVSQKTPHRKQAKER